MPILDDIDRLLRDHERYLGNGGTQALPIGDRSSSVRPIYKSDLRELLRLIVAAGGSGGGVGIASSSYNATTGRITLNFTDGTTSQTGDLRGPPGGDGDDGVGISGSNYDTETGAITLTFTNGTTFTTGDLRGEGGSGGTEDAVARDAAADAQADADTALATSVPYASYTAALDAPKPAALLRISATVGGRFVEWIRRTGGPCLGGGWDAAGRRSVLHHGALGDGATNDLAAFDAAISHLTANGGGELHIPYGTFRLLGRWNVPTNYVTIKGEGRLATRLDFANSASSGVTIGTVFYPDVSGFTVLNAGGAGFEAGSFPVGPQANLAWGRIADIEVAQSGGDGFLFRNMFMMDISNLRSQNAGGYGFNWDGASDSGTKTSLNVRACHAVQATLGGHRIKNICYSEFTAMGADRCGGYGYHLENLQNVRVHGGCENAALSAILCHYDATDSDLLDGFKGVTISIWEKDSHWNGTAVAEDVAYGKLATFTAAVNTARCGGVTFDGCSNYNPLATASNIRIIGGNWNVVAARGANPGMSLTVSGGSFSTFARDFNAVSNGLNINVTAANTPIAQLHPALRNSVIQYGGRITVCAVRSALSSSSKSATYELLVNRGVGGTFVTQIASVGSTAGAAVDECSFTFSIDAATNRLLASPVGSTSGSFYFHFHCTGNLDIDPL